MSNDYKFEKNIPELYNLSVKLIDSVVARGDGRRTAVYYQDEKISYLDLQRRVNRVGNALKSLGVGLEQRVAIVMNDTPDAMASFFGIIKLGAVAIPLNYMYTKHDFRYLLNNSRATTLIADAEFIEEIEGFRDEFIFLKNTIVRGGVKREGQADFDTLVSGSSEELDPPATIADDSAFWNYTSGSTGVPKGVIHLQHDALFSIEKYSRGVLGITKNDVIFSASKFFFAYGLGNSFFFPLGNGATVVLLPDRPLAETVFETIEKYRPTVFFGIPTLYSNLLQFEGADNYDMTSLRICVSAGEHLPKEIYNRWKEKYGLEILDGIGSTEVLHIYLSNQPGAVKPGSTGKVVPGYEARIVGEDGNILPDNEVGILQVKGDSTAASYYLNHEKTKESMLGDWFVTGDEYYRDEEGYYYYYGRSNDMMKVGGIWVSPIEIESTIMGHPSVLETAVVAHKDKNNLVKPKAFIILKDEYEPTEDLKKEIQGYVRENLAKYKYPRWIEFIDELPKTATGKIQRFRLKEK